MTSTKSHHTAEGFRNNYPTAARGSFWRWQRERWANGMPRMPVGGYHFDLCKPDIAALHVNRAIPTMTWIGHATFLLQLAGLNILTDPHLTARASPLRFAGPQRLVPPAIGLHELPHVDVVILSHNHYDHLDLATVKHLARQAGGSPLFLVPLGLKAWFTGRGIRRVHELDWWDRTSIGPLVFHFVPAQHWSSRTPWDRNKSLWGGWMVETDGFRFLFVGDTGYSRDFLDIAARFAPIDLAAIPIGAYEPRWFMQAMHVNPEEAVQIHLDLRARYSVAMHWGTFVLTDEPMDEPPRRLASARRAARVSSEAFFVMRHGETRDLHNLMRADALGQAREAVEQDKRSDVSIIDR
ncbi:MAG TPA: MBL fold metallo-hydrolase [Burkholderiales bacterium]|nr:MBL fold metallo-hydrolase [Burkholderiales bacterium]